MTVAELVALCALGGLFVGSYLGVLADRVPAGRPTMTGRSHCDSCDRPLSWWELLPVVSWLALRGRCRTCKARVPAQSTVMELATAVLFGAMAWRFGAHWELGAYLVLVAALVALTAIDLRTQTLPRRIIYAAAVGAVPFLVAGALVAERAQRLGWAGFGAAVALAFFGLLYLGWRDGMGDGDVRLAPLLGAHLGWIGPLHVPVGLFLGFLSGALVGIVLLARGKGRKMQIPFGPFMALGAVVMILWGHPIIDFWLRR